MTTGFLQKIFGSRNQRLVKQYQKTVAAINALEPQIEQLTDDQLRAKTTEFRQRVGSGESLDKLLPEAFAVCREASRLAQSRGPWGMTPRARSARPSSGRSARRLVDTLAYHEIDMAQWRSLVTVQRMVVRAGFREDSTKGERAG